MQLNTLSNEKKTVSLKKGKTLEHNEGLHYSQIF